MKRTIRKNMTDLPYSLHDARVIGFEVNENILQMKFQSGFVCMVAPFKQVEGFVEFEKIDWDFCYVYLLEYQEVLCGNPGSFTGKKMELGEFINEFHNASFEIIDETYGYNLSKFMGYFSKQDSLEECIIELYHWGDMSYILEG